VISRELPILLRKELRQLWRSKAAMATALLLPALMIVGRPVLMSLTTGVMGQVPNMPKGVELPAGLKAASEDPMAVVRMMLPLFIGLGGLVAPMVAASYTLVTEREQRTLELLVALPVRIETVLLAKLVPLVAMTGAISLALFTGSALFLLGSGTASLGAVGAFAVELVAAIFCSAGMALLASLLAKDMRTANNLSGIVILPAMILAGGLGAFTPHTALVALLLALAYVVMGGAALLVATKVVTVERLLR